MRGNRVYVTDNLGWNTMCELEKEDSDRHQSTSRMGKGQGKD